LWRSQAHPFARDRAVCSETRPEPTPGSNPEPVVYKNRPDACVTLVDDWDAMDSDQRKRVLGSIFEEIVAGGDGISELLPREG
jgi:hypothetical protein